jgi:exodeoxyribonuclease-3
VSLRILSYNIRRGGVGREQLIAEVIRGCSPDFVVLQEAIRPPIVEALARACGMKVWGASPGDSLAFLSHFPVGQYSWRRVRWARRAHLEIILESGLRVYGVHLSAVHSNLTERRRMYELRALLSSIASHVDGDHFVVGDFNSLAPGERLDLSRLPARLQAFTFMTGRNIRWTTIRTMLQAGYQDGFRLFHADEEGFTFPTSDPHIRLDYTFVPERFASRLRSCDVVRSIPAARHASDHFPIVAEFEH